MEVSFATRKLQKLCSSQQAMVREWGPENARRLATRLAELQAADTLEDMRNLPQARCHELRGDRKGQISLALSHPYRLIVTPHDYGAALDARGGLDWSKVDSVVVEEIVDYH